MKSLPIARELVLVGGGHSHVIVLRMLGMNPVPGLQITLVSPGTLTPYSGMLPGVIAGHYTPEEIHIDLVPLCEFAGARFFRDRVTGVDLATRKLRCERHPDIRYDVVSFDIGITPAMADVPGASENVIPVKPIDRFLDRWESFRERVEKGKVRNVAVVGAGAGGVELCLAIQYRLETEFGGRSSSRIQFHLIHDGEDILREYPESVKIRFMAILARRGIRVWPGFRVASIADKVLHSVRGDAAAMDEIFWVTAAAPQSWLKDTGLALDDQGFIAVGDTLQSISDENVFAVGDIASVLPHPRPKAGVYAVRQGPPLETNLRRKVLGQPLKPFKPQTGFLSLISTGDKTAIAHRNRFSARGHWVWRWKDWIDRRFMNRFSDLPPMKQEVGEGLLSEFDDQMHCGGCGAKVSANLLAEVLDEHDISSPGLLDDAAVFDVPDGEVMLHTVDAFRSFVSDPYTFARIAVSHAVSDIYAMGGKPVTALAVVTLPFARPAVTKAMLSQLMAGSLKQLDIDRISLVGGHTSEGMELSLGFSINGIVRPDALFPKTGLRAGDCLILTKALGTGTLFAANMQYRAKGEWIRRAEESMMQSSRRAMEIFQQYEVHACTDITGFGLAGHLGEMLAGSPVGIQIDLDGIPVLDGALLTLNEMGIHSTLHAGNRDAATGLPDVDHPVFGLLFDPQTSGGLLASLPADSGEDCLHQLRQAGYDAATVIGRVDDGPAGIRFDQVSE